MKKIIAICLMIFILSIGVCYAVTFSDVSGHWGESYINSIADKGIINGYPDGTFKPNGTIKKGEYLKLVMTAFIPKFDWTQPNVKYNHWSSIYIEKAEREGIIEEGEIDATTANEEITREEVANILAKCDILLANNPQQKEEMEFYDISELSEESMTYLAHCVARGLITGYDDATFKPYKTLTRAEVATILYRYLNK